jgi:hypothetical protein
MVEVRELRRPPSFLSAFADRAQETGVFLLHGTIRRSSVLKYCLYSALLLPRFGPLTTKDTSLLAA